LTQFNPELAPGGEVNYSPATWRDLGEVRQLENLCFPEDAWPLLDLVSTLTLPGIIRFKAVKNDHIVGFVAGEIKRYQQAGWIATICVHPKYRGYGIGRKLLELCEQKLPTQRIKLSVRASNHSAIRMYEQAGYTMVGRWRRYYKGGEDALVMEKEI
jgi:ribosomal protein S18 acetylase RimI-like enzyme